jgi:peptide deformylase
VLKKRARPIREVNDKVVARAHEMLEFMYESEGVGLAAPQVGWSSRLATVDADLSRTGERIFLNPCIIAKEGEEEEEEEGCLSLPGVRLPVLRSARIVVVAYTLNGKRVEIEADGLLSRAWQHEMDHLDGLLIIDRAPPAARMAVRRQLRQLEKEARAGQPR